VAEFGIELVDVQIRRVNYVTEVQQKVFDRMISERRRIAERSRSEGQGKAAEIRGRRSASSRASSRRRTARPGDHGQGRRRVDAHLRGGLRAGPRLYQFLKTMETYRKTMARTRRSSCPPTASSQVPQAEPLMPDAIVLRGLTKTFGATVAVRDFDLAVRRAPSTG